MFKKYSTEILLFIWGILAFSIIFYCGFDIINDVKARDKYRYSAWIKETGNKHELTYEEWNATY